MAKKRTANRTTTRVIRVGQPRAAAPIVVRTTARAPAKVHHRRRSSSGGGGSGKTMIGSALGGAIFGFIEKKFPTMPTIPVVGRAGTVAIAAYFLSKKGGFAHGGIVRDVGNAAAAIAGYQLGGTGKIAGDDDVIHGVAYDD